jgi:exonuclease SbcC
VQQLAGPDLAAREQDELAAVEAQVAELGYSKANHDDARRQIAELVGAEVEKAELDKAQQALAELHAGQQPLTQSRAHWSTALAVDQQREQELLAVLTELESLAQQLQSRQRELDELRAREGRARQVVGAAQQKLDYCQYLAAERKKRSQQVTTLTEERSLYEELQLAFGKKGLQALIIETAVPEIEEEANALLSRMTDGRMSVRFDTQRDTKAGNTVETLDIKIADERGPRSYEMYSGGEAFRVDFAVRIALSKLLARRAGAQLQTLIIDEGFGTQDADGRQRLVEAINSVSEDFKLVIVITHIEELKDAFPVRIEVTKTAQGSQISVY